MGIISPHITHYRFGQTSQTETGTPHYECRVCGMGFESVHRICPDCSGQVRKL